MAVVFSTSPSSSKIKRTLSHGERSFERSPPSTRCKAINPGAIELVQNVSFDFCCLNWFLSRHKWTWFARLVVLMMLFWFSNGPDSVASAFDSGEPLITADETGLTVSWVPPQPSITTIEIDGDLFSQIQVSGTSSLGQPGAPQLPLFAGLVGLPPTGGAQL